MEYEGRDGTIYAKSRQAPVGAGKYTVTVTTTNVTNTLNLSVIIEKAIEQPAGDIEFYVEGVKIATVTSVDFIDNNDGTYNAAAAWSGMTAKIRSFRQVCSGCILIITAQTV